MSVADAALPGGLAGAVEGRLPRWARDAIERSRGHDLVLFASGLAFYAIVSLAPLTILTIWIAGMVLGDDGVARLARAVEEIAPPGLGAHSAITTVADAGTSAGLPAAIAGLWPATAYGSGVARAFLRLSPHRRRKFKGLRARGLLLVVLLPLFVLGGLVGSFVGSAIVGGEGIQRVIGWVLALGTGFLGVGSATVLLYKIFPPEPLSWAAALKGTAVAAGGISILSLGFTVYLSLAPDVSGSYGGAGLAGLVLLGLWLFLSNIMLLFGYQVALDPA